jgi:hydrogen peroxide-dependent heme synthase
MSQGAEAEAASPQAPTQPMQHGHRPASSALVPATLVPEAGWHVLHLFYRIDRGALARLAEADRQRGREEFLRALERPAGGGIEQSQCFAVPGHKADFGLIMAGPDLRALHGVQVAIQATTLGPALVPCYSFYSITEVSEYVPDAEQYGAILRDREGMDPDSPSYKTKLAQYANRLGPMNRQRLYPEFPDWPCLCFYPMSKMRQGEQNWYLRPFEERAEMMSQHGRSGMKFAGRVTQLITASTGLDDWEWGVTLWARNPSYLKDIVYGMRFDESSARYALFGAFYFGYILPPAELLAAVRL